MSKTRAVLDKAAAGVRLDAAEGLELLQSGDPLSLGRAANRVRQRWHPGGWVTFVIDRNINYTNVCVSACRFCAFHCSPTSPEAYVLSNAEILQKIEKLVQFGGTQVLIQGGLHPDLGLDYYTGMLRAIKSRFNSLQVHSLSPPEIVHLARRENLPVRELLVILKEAGLDSLPGGGAEILVDRVRRLISPRKIPWREWMEVMLIAHDLGMRTTATMMFGTVETPAERVRHLVRLREAQDRTGGFTAFIPWSYQPVNTALGGESTDSLEYLKLLAVSRLMLDNFPSIQASWVTQGAKVGQVALAFGANDFGGTMLEENVVRAAGVAHRVPLDQIIRVIRDAGFRPAQRTTTYEILREF